tara:strand:+ start:1551 stop:1778 length:228 start_codon:yes stop_codon:yes gene_type:complete
MSAIVNDRYLKSIEVAFLNLSKEEALEKSRANSKLIEDLDKVILKSTQQANVYCNALAKREVYMRIMIRTVKHYL